MALRAGYYGIKRGLKAKLVEIAETWDQVATKQDLVDGHLLPGKNLFNPDKVESGAISTTTGEDVSSSSYDRINGYIMCSEKTDYVVSGLTGTDLRVFFYKADNTYLSYVENVSGKFTTPENCEKIRLRWLHSYSTAAFQLEKGSVATTYEAYYYPLKDFQSMTNSHLSTIDSTLTDHKTTINAIISAATGAADFAAFKTAMEALTPLTRSIPSGSDQRSLQDVTPEVEPEEKEVEEASEPVTKKTTKKTVKEGE